MNRVVFALVAVLLLLSISSITGLIKVVKADSGTITINADGSISPSTAPIYTADNITYNLTGNINITNDTNGIVVERDNIVLNGAGYAVTGSGSGNGITLFSMSNVLIENTMITNFTEGIVFSNSSNNRLDYYNTITANSNNGIVLDSSSGNNLGDNNITANNNYDIFLDSSSNNVIAVNYITNSEYGIGFNVSSNNLIYQNNFWGNINQVYTYDSNNTWDSEGWGNYWSDYLTKYPNAVQVGPTGAQNWWNTPYVIDPNNIDYYPMVDQQMFPEFPSFLILSLFLITILLAVIIYKKKATPYRRL